MRPRTLRASPGCIWRRHTATLISCPAETRHRLKPQPHKVLQHRLSTAARANAGRGRAVHSLRTNIGNVPTLDDAVAAFNPTKRIKAKRITDKTIIRVRPERHAPIDTRGRRCPGRLAASYQRRRGQLGKLPMAPGIRCRTGFLSLEHIQQGDK
jgi:hypothetical protein